MTGPYAIERFGGSRPHDGGRGCGLRAAAYAVRGLSHAANAAIFAALFLMLLGGLYALWDAGAVYAQASASKWQAYVPAADDHGTYDELAALNSDVVGWIDVYGTNIDYPLVQSDDDTKYLTHDAKGDYSLTGALFLDAANADDFTDFSTIVYGHHLESDVMFGEIGNFADAEYFAAREYGTLFVGRGPQAHTMFGLHFIAFLGADAYDGSIYRPKVEGAAEQRAYLDHLLGAAVNTRDVPVEPAAGERIVLLSTCSSEGTNARSILVAKVESAIHEDPFVAQTNTGIGADMPEGWFSFPWIGWAALAALLALLAAFVLARIDRRRRHRAEEAARDAHRAAEATGRRVR